MSRKGVTIPAEFAGKHFGLDLLQVSAMKDSGHLLLHRVDLAWRDSRMPWNMQNK